MQKITGQKPLIKEVDKIILIVVIVIALAFALMFQTLCNTPPKKNGKGNTTQLEIYSANDIYYVDVEKWTITSESGYIDSQYPSFEAMSIHLSDLTAEDANSIIEILYKLENQVKDESIYIPTPLYQY